jgi:hypothetical protein
MSGNKKQKLSEPLVYQERESQIYGGKPEMLTITPEARGGKTKQEYLASLTEEAKDKIHAQAFRFLMARINDSLGGDDFGSYLCELVGDVIEDPYPWGDANDEEKRAVDKQLAEVEKVKL